MSTFFRFPHTPHLSWLGPGSPRDDKILSSRETEELLNGEVVVEEKLDGANLGISVDPQGAIRFQNRGQYLVPPYSGQFARLASWFAPSECALTDALGEKLILFGEWCTARHSLHYRELPAWFLAFDVYDRRADRFWSTARRNSLAEQLSLDVVPTILAGHSSMEQLKKLVLDKSSSFRSGPLEGIVIRKETPEWLLSRAKLVHPDFTQAINEHWSRRGLEWNRLATQAPSPS